MNFLLDPNVAYLGLVSAFLLITLAILTPGTGVIEILAAIALLYSGFAVYNLPVNFLALIILLIGVVPFMLAVRRSGKLIYLVISILALVVGSTLLFVEEGLSPAVNPILAAVVSTFVAVFLWITARKTIEAVATPPAHGMERLLGNIGTAASDIYEEGSVQIESELWSARSDAPIPGGTEVRVVGIEGFTLVVEKGSKPGVDNGAQKPTTEPIENE